MTKFFAKAILVLTQGSFLVHLYRKSYCTVPGIGICGGRDGSKMLKFYIKIFYVMGKALSGKLSCMWTSLVCGAWVLASW